MTVDPSLAELSDTLFSIAVALYSVAVVAFTADVEDWLGIEVEPTAVWDHPTIAQLAKFLLEGREQASTA